MKVAKLRGFWPIERTVADMRIGEVAYVVPWAYNPRTEELQDSFLIQNKPFGDWQAVRSPG